MESYFGSNNQGVVSSPQSAPTLRTSNLVSPSASNPVSRSKPTSKLKLAKKYLFTGPIKRKVLITQGIKHMLPNHYKVLENDIHKLINSLSPYIPTLKNKNNTRSNGNHGKRFIQDLFNLLIAIYKIKPPPDGPKSPYWEGVMKGINEYNYKNVENIAFEKLANKIGLPDTNKIVLNNIFTALRSPANSRTIESGKALGKDLAHILRHYKGSGQVLKSETSKTSETRNKKYLEGIVLGLRPLGLEIIGEKNSRLANIVRFATSKTVRAPGHTLRRVKLFAEIPKALVCKRLAGIKIIYSAEKFLKGVGSELMTWDSIPDNVKCIIKKLSSDTGTKIVVNSYKQRWYKVLGDMLNIYKKTHLLKTAGKTFKNINVALHPVSYVTKQVLTTATTTAKNKIPEALAKYARIQRIEKGMKNTIEGGNARKRVFESTNVLRPYKKWFNAVSARNKNKPNKRLTIEEAMSVIPRNARFKTILSTLSTTLNPEYYLNNSSNKKLTAYEAMSVIPRKRFKKYFTTNSNSSPEYNSRKFLTNENKILLLKLSEREKLSRFGALKKRVFG